ncbi:MAG: hypothetical protein JWO04_2171 [Gammaproteobacteria bacterium]|jgi:hypothetical protein|nr:hypothetical protein [Gammaproteobacteria bacterium]
MDATIGNKSVAQAELPGTRASSSSGDDADRTDAARLLGRFAERHEFAERQQKEVMERTR